MSVDPGFLDSNAISMAVWPLPVVATAEEHPVTELELDVTDLPTIELTNIEEALALIDKGLGGLTERQLVSASEVTDLLLDVRSVLSDTAAS